MAGERTFVVKILGNADGAITAFKKLAREGQDTIGQLQTVGNALGGAFDVVKKAAFIAVGAFTAVAGAATAAALAAAEDEQSQKRLASQLERTTGASALQVEMVERFITSAMLATGVADTELRNGFANLARATGDATESQRLLNLGLDISAATGKDLESVTIALGKASTGQVTALSKLGIPIDENTKKSKDFSAALSQLELQFGGAAAASADTFSGRVKVLQASLGEVVESIGFALLPFFEKMVKFIQDHILPALIAFADNVGEHGIGLAIGFAINAMGDLGISFIDTLESMTLAVLNFLKQFTDLGRTIALTIGFTAALTGNAVLAVKATAASLMFKAAQNGLNDALESTPGMFDRIRSSMAQAAAIQSRALPNIIGTADALERQVNAGKKNIVVDKEQINVGGGVAKTVETAKQKFEKYTDALKGSTSAQKAFTNAQKGSVQAQRSLNDANAALTVAQDNFTQAINGYGKDSIQAKDAQRDLSKAQRNVENSGYRVEESVFAVRDAELKLAEVRADPESNPQMIREAEINLAQAKLAVSDATDAQYEATTGLSKAQTLLNEAVSGAIVGSATYNIFLDLVNKAKEQQETASERLTDALDRETEAYENLAEAIAKVAEAAKNSGRANLTIPSLPTVPTAGSSGVPSDVRGGGGATIVVNTGIGTNGVEAGRQIVQLLQQYTAVDAFAIDRLGFAPRR
jgi:hypothetical protein